jgi:hypothetical protein
MPPVALYVKNTKYFLCLFSCVRAGGPVGGSGRNLADPDHLSLRRPLRQERGGRLLQLQAVGVHRLPLLLHLTGQLG